MRRHRLIPAAAALALLAIPSAASAADRDHDRMRDSWEKHYGLSVKTNDARRDKDRDGLRNRDEYRAGTNPRDRDSDDDGRRDGRENVGTIKSFDAQSGVLVIDLFTRDEDLTGKVVPSTEIECEHDGRRHDGDDGENGTGDTRGDGTPEDRTLLRDGDDNRSGSNSGRDDDSRSDDDDDDACTADSLDPGRIVHEAETATVNGETVFEELELIR